MWFDTMTLMNLQHSDLYTNWMEKTAANSARKMWLFSIEWKRDKRGWKGERDHWIFPYGPLCCVSAHHVSWVGMMSGTKKILKMQKPVSLNVCAQGIVKSPRDERDLSNVSTTTTVFHFLLRTLDNYVITWIRRPSPKAIKPIYKPFIEGNYAFILLR